MRDDGENYVLALRCAQTAARSRRYGEYDEHVLSEAISLYQNIKKDSHFSLYLKRNYGGE